MYEVAVHGQGRMTCEWGVCADRARLQNTYHQRVFAQALLHVHSQALEDTTSQVSVSPRRQRQTLAVRQLPQAGAQEKYHIKPVEPVHLHTIVTSGHG